ncbi:hypothetical protein EXIGLDRAFT_113996 [Exidia glandulosa HHB12029]|uniref:Uncharacterized protein n=1 Tax=Exidia glandulosa HHB12029 TaxID=1314781 RepID=A0A165GM49_EXIGL|nr:hypothetical protein EXIGLDRAFT_113996 [Exidia glandulosa HHB12029]
MTRRRRYSADGQISAKRHHSLLHVYTVRRSVDNGRGVVAVAHAPVGRVAFPAFYRTTTGAYGKRRRARGVQSCGGAGAEAAARCLGHDARLRRGREWRDCVGCCEGAGAGWVGEGDVAGALSRRWVVRLDLSLVPVASSGQPSYGLLQTL